MVVRLAADNSGILAETSGTCTAGLVRFLGLAHLRCQSRSATLLHYGCRYLFSVTETTQVSWDLNVAGELRQRCTRLVVINNDTAEVRCSLP